jgi:hypothetical protein
MNLFLVIGRVTSIPQTIVDIHRSIIDTRIVVAGTEEEAKEKYKKFWGAKETADIHYRIVITAANKVIE